MPLVSIAWPSPLHEARFLTRPNRFVLRCRLAATGGVVTAHLADPGRLRELLVAGRRVWLRDALGARRGGGAPRRTRWSAALVQTPSGRGLVSLDTTLPNRLVAAALRAGALPELGAWTLERAEVTVGHSRFDFLLCDPGARGAAAGPWAAANGGQRHRARRIAADGTVRGRMLLEVKSVTLVEDGVGLFPDAVTARGARHLRELADLARHAKCVAAVLFVVQRPDAQSVRAARHIDPGFAEALQEARAAGVQVLARRCRVGLNRVVLGASLPVLSSGPAPVIRERSAP
jgi:sugar fermentation stimulation protein A